ncbi:hypothetical protein [Mesorhizobium retamae]|uniref:Uncharacterized protein n=1 Tax=Mesorhizobium retamae TaxID=2912854 RepID=A0ABS9QP63_9HYPH|nr:hypothetical protein [Mesorhizobium sp. IRAMC:0171]MCG7509240.1 hypothetical protein [Mesorhizobium sp. IRAMC:0171]
MKDKLRNIEIYSEDQVLEELRKKPRTLGWDMISVYNREKTNLILYQEYISRYTKNLHLDPINDSVAIDDNGPWEYMYDYILDAPRLSFENSSINDSVAKLSMQVMGGIEIKVTQSEGGAKAISSISWIDALGAPKVIAALTLHRTPGNIGDEGLVYLSLNDGVDFELLFSGARQARRRFGAFFKELFDNLPPEKRRYVLNTIKLDNSQLLSPESFELRVHKPMGSNLRESPRYGDGSVVQFISMKGSSRGNMPADDAGMPYLIPDGCSATMLIGQHFLIKKIIAEGVKNFSNDKDVEVEVVFDTDNAEEALRSATIKGGSRTMEGWTQKLGAFEIVVSESKWGLTKLDENPETSTTNEFKVSFPAPAANVAAEVVSIEWTGSQQPETALTISGKPFSGKIGVSWIVKRDFEFKPQSYGGLKLVEKSSRMQFKVSPGDYSREWEVMPHFGTIATALENSLSEKVGEAFGDFVAPSEEIEHFRLASLLFRTDQSEILETTSARLPMDLAVFGNIVPKKAAFDVMPIEHTLRALDDGEARTLQFRTVPEMQDVKWSVRAVPGFNDAYVGTIDEHTGMYIPARMIEIDGLQTRVIVTAQTAEGTSSALLNVVKRDISVNPRVTTVSLGGSPYPVWANALDKKNVTFSLESYTGGRIEAGGVRDELSGEVIGTHKYLPGGRPDGDRSKYSIDTLTFVNSETGGIGEAYFFVPHVRFSVEVKVDYEASQLPHRVKLKAFIEGEESEGVDWIIEKGEGIIDGDFYVPKLDGEDKFAIIIAKDGSSTGVIILPIPLIDLENVRLMLI